MAGAQWSSDVVVRLGVFDDTVLVIDGIHRSIAYLACLEDGIVPERLRAAGRLLSRHRQPGALLPGGRGSVDIARSAQSE